MKKLEDIMDQISSLRFTRRQALKGFAAAAAVAAFPRGLTGAPAFKPAWLNQYTYVAPDMKKTADWYREVFGMQAGTSDSKKTHLWYGDRGGDTLMIVRQAENGEQSPRLERFGFTIENWNRAAVEAELKRRGRQPQADTDKGFWFKDPEGNDIGVFSRDYVKRPSASPQKPALWKAVSANHIVVLSPDYKKMADFYKDLLDLRQTVDSGRDVYLWFGDSLWIPTAVREGGKSSAELKTLDHVAYTIETYDTNAVAAELKKRKLLGADVDPKGSLGIYCVDLNGFKIQVCDKDLVPNAERARGQRG